MSEQMMQELLTRVDGLSAKLGEGAMFAWQVHMRQAYIVDGWFDVISGGVFLLLAICVAITAVLLLRRKRPNPGYSSSLPSSPYYPPTLYLIEDSDARLNVTVFSAVLVVLLSILAIVLFVGGVTHVLNPGFYALRSLAQMLIGR